MVTVTDALAASIEPPLWWPPAKVAGRFLAPYLFDRDDESSLIWRHGVCEPPKCGSHLIAGAMRRRDGSGMAANPIVMPLSPGAARVSAGVVMSSAEYAALVRELDTLRAALRRELAQRLHDVQTVGTTSDYDDHLAVLEETAVDRARIAQLNHLVRVAAVLDGEDDRLDGSAGLGSKVEVADATGRTTAYRLIGRRTAESPTGDVSLGSPVGKALAGARVGDVVRVRLPNGRDRTLTVLAVGDAAAEPRLTTEGRQIDGR